MPHLTPSLSNSDDLHETAWAKINLSLRILGRWPDGYHELSSVVGFADYGDQLRLEPGSGFKLNVSGVFAGSIIGSNLISSAAQALMDDFGITDIGTLSLEKNLPVAAGIGGGSADAAAFLRLMARVFDLSFSNDDLVGFSRRFGADVPVCMGSKPALMSGIGQVVCPLDAFPSIGILLVNPGVSISTKSIFNALNLPKSETVLNTDHGSLTAFHCLDDVMAMMRKLPNDLMGVALKQAPVIGTVLETIESVPGCKIARLSGSGATCFGLFDNEEAAKAGARFIKKQHEDWWVCASTLKPCG